MNDIIGIILTIVAVAILLAFFIRVYKDTHKGNRRGPTVIKRGKIPTKKAECEYCHSIINYTPDDVWSTETTHIIVCPVCNKNINVELFKTKGDEQ